MIIKILYDNEARSGLSKAWGFSCLIKLKEERILFDTGWDGEVLLSNMHRLGESPEDIGSIVLSHSHWDHIGGVNHLRGSNIQVWVPKSFSAHLKAELASRFDVYEVGGPAKICEGVWTTGELGKGIREQSLVIRTQKGLLLIVGCSHPGVNTILTAASRLGMPWGIAGGMHGFDDYDLLEPLGLIIPAHCTVNRKTIVDLFPEKTIEGEVGLEVDLG